MTDGFQPGELKIQSWELFDEWNQNFKGVLTFETPGAPMLMRISCRRCVKGQEFVLAPCDVYHEDQVVHEFSQASTDHVMKMKNWGCKVMSLATIVERKNKKLIASGKVVAAAESSGRLQKRLPQVPQFPPAGSSPCFAALMDKSPAGSSPGFDDELSNDLEGVMGSGVSVAASTSGLFANLSAQALVVHSAENPPSGCY